MRRAAARSGEWAQHFSNASCIYLVVRIGEANQSQNILHRSFHQILDTYGSAYGDKRNILFVIAQETLYHGKLQTDFIEKVGVLACQISFVALTFWNELE